MKLDSSKIPYSRPEADVIIVVTEKNLAQSQTETIVDDPTEHDWD